MGENDPLGGLAHRDYYRDPAMGYSPQYAPRNFARGGEVAYPHLAGQPQTLAEAAAQRDWLQHDVSAMQDEQKASRRTMRALDSASERDEYVRRMVPPDRFRSALVENQSLNVLEQLQHSTVTSSERIRQHSTVDRFTAASASNAAPASVSAFTPSAEQLVESAHAQYNAITDDALDEGLRLVRGVRDKERFDHTVMQRTSRVPFQGYDMDRHEAQSRGTPFMAQQLPPAMPASSVEEAQKQLRGGPTPSSSAESLMQRAYAQNTVSDSPKIGEALTEELAETLRVTRETEKVRAKQEHDQRFGIGRQGALVQDGGPDRRVIKKQTNDERLLYAMLFKGNAYRQSPTDEHVNPYIRGNTEDGVGHLLTNRFDIERRDDRLARGEDDLTERQTMHFGVPVQQSIDEFVLRHRNARGDRPLDYFKPFPDFRALRLYHVFRDTEGFSLMKQRPEFLEWELFVRYRAHHQQRRELALREGLEPVPNETATERAARRRALDEVCERTPFDPTRITLHDDEMPVSVDVLRNWFGVYVLPSPTVTTAVVGTGGAGEGDVGVHLQPLPDELGTADTREHLLSGRYLNQLLLNVGYQHRIGRGFVNEVLGRAPEPVIKYAQPPEVLRLFSKEEQAMYQEYVKSETERQQEAWKAQLAGRRYVPDRGQYGVIEQPGYAMEVVDVEDVETGTVLTLSAKKYEKELQVATTGNGTTLRVDGREYSVISGTRRRVVPLLVKLESGELLETTDEVFSTYPMEVDPNAQRSHHLNFGIGDYTYNRGNYVETQDVLWEQATANGEEGWSPATHADGLRPGLPVRARRQLGADEASAGAAEDSAARVVGDYQRGRIVQYYKQPFFNPEPRLVTIAFASDGVVQQVPLSDVLIWQRQHYGPERTVGEETRRYNPAGLRRYVDVADPNNEAVVAHLSNDGATSSDHFLEKYEVRSPDSANSKYRTTKQISEIDSWNSYDTRRSDNHRPLSISHRRDYVRQGYLLRYTPWEWIAIQEADQPLIHETMRTDNVGVGYFASLNRFWRYKARPHGYLRNYEHEVRDLLQYVDGVTPWKQAQKIRTYWEVRQHHPMPQFNRPEVAMHRNTAALLPTHLWESDKKTGKVKAVKDSVRDYQTKTPIPKWVQL